MNVFFKLTAVILSVLFSFSLVTSDAVARDRNKKEDVVEVKGQGKHRFVEANGRKFSCLGIRMSLFKQFVSCEEVSQDLNPQSGERDGAWSARSLDVVESTTTAGELIPVVTAGIISPSIQRSGAISSARAGLCQTDACRLVVNNHVTAQGGNGGSVTVGGPTVHVTSTNTVNGACTSGCPRGQ